MGGLSKKASQLKTKRRDEELPVLTLDGGALLFKSINIDPNLAVQTEITARGIVDAYNLMSYDAVGISSRDLANGVDFLLAMQERSQFSWLSANLIARETSAPVFKPYIEMKAGNLRIAVIGLTDNLIGIGNKIGARYKIADWSIVLPGIINKLQGNIDFIILLTGYDQKNCQEIAASHPRINLIIPAFSIENLAPKRLSETTLYARTGKQGKYLGMMKIAAHPEVWWDNGEQDLFMQKNKELKQLERQAEIFRNRPAATSQVGELLTRIERLKGEIGELEMTLQSNSTRQRGSTFDNLFLPMRPDLPDDQEVLSLVERIKEQINQAETPAERTN